MVKGFHFDTRLRWLAGLGLFILGGYWAGTGNLVLLAQAQTKPATPAGTAAKPTPTPVPTGKKGLPADYKLNVPVMPPAAKVVEPVQAGQGSTPAAPPAQTKPPQVKVPQEPEQGNDTFRISSNLVAVPVSVTDGTGEPVRNLRAEEFRLEEEGQSQQLQSLGEPGKTPLELALLFDVSGSVRERFEFEKSAATRFLQQVLKAADTVTVFSIGFEPKIVSTRSGSLETVTNNLRRLEPTKEGTAFFDTVVRASRYLNDNATPGSRRVLVVISDGEDNHSEDFRLEDAQRELQRSDTIFYAINPSGPSIRLNKISMRGHSGLTELANDTGGMAFLPDQDVELERVFKQIAAELQAQYLLGYYSSNETNDGKFRRIKIQLPSHPVLRIRARQGYYAPKD